MNEGGYKYNIDKQHMREIFFYISTAVFMFGFMLLLVFKVVFTELSVLMYIVPIYLMVSGAAMAALVSCFEPRRDSANHETRQLMFRGSEQLDATSERSSSPIDEAIA